MTIREIIEYWQKIRPHHFTVLRHDMLQPGIRGSAARHRQVNGSDGRNHAPIICGVQAAFFLYCNKAFFGHSFIGTALAYPTGVGRLQYSDDNMLTSEALSARHRMTPPGQS